jgi:hypothetical protein
MKIHKAENLTQGDTWEILGRLHYADGTPFNLGVGCAIAWKVEDGAGNVIVSATLVGGQISVTPVPGECLIVIVPGNTRAIPVGNYTDQLQAIDPTGYTSTQWTGPINVTKSFFV